MIHQDIPLGKVTALEVMRPEFYSLDPHPSGWFDLFQFIGVFNNYPDDWIGAAWHFPYNDESRFCDLQDGIYTEEDLRDHDYTNFSVTWETVSSIKVDGNKITIFFKEHFLEAERMNVELLLEVG